MSRLASALLVWSLLASPAMAQVRLPATTPDTNPAHTAFRRAQRLVNDGNGGRGRFVVDSLVEAADPGSAAEAQALFWRATLAPTWGDAQRDYLRIMLEHERSPLAAESMFRLARGSSPVAIAAQRSVTSSASPARRRRHRSAARRVSGMDGC